MLNAFTSFLWLASAAIAGDPPHVAGEQRGFSRVGLRAGLLAERALQVHATPAADLAPPDAAATAAPTVEIVGLMHSGSNLLESMLRDNFPAATYHRGLYADWKHGVLEDSPCVTDAVLAGSVVLSIARDPLEYFERMYGEFYEYWCGRCRGCNSKMILI
jgi:hypothetical protein